MSVSLTVINASHPCAAVERALELKGVPYTTVELPFPFHAAIQRVRTGRWTVPSMKLDGETVSGSRAIMRRLDAYVPAPPLYGNTDAERIRIEEAERWGDEELQSLTRRIVWAALTRRPESLPSYLEGSRLPRVPRLVVKGLVQAIVRVELRLNDTSADGLADEARTLLGLLDRIDGWLSDGTLGGDRTNAADLQIASSLAVLMKMADLTPVIGARPCGPWAQGLFPEARGAIPAGVVPAEALRSVPA